MNILALDLGTQTGWAVQVTAGIFSGSQSFKATRFEGAGMRFLKMAKWLDQFQGVQLVLYEEVRRHIGTDAAHAYGGFLATLQGWCEANGIPYQGITVQAIKKFATGKGNAKKDVMILAAQEMGYSPSDDNEADALLLLHLGIKEYASAVIASQRSAPDRKPRRRVQVVVVPVARRRVRVSPG